MENLLENKLYELEALEKKEKIDFTLSDQKEELKNTIKILKSEIPREKEKLKDDFLNAVKDLNLYQIETTSRDVDFDLVFSSLLLFQRKNNLTPHEKRVLFLLKNLVEDYFS